MCCSTDSSVGSIITALQPNSFAICAVLQCECNSFLDLPRVESGFMRTHTYMQLYSFEIFSVPQRKCYSFVVLLRAALGSERTVLQLNGFEICSVPQCQCSSFVIITSPGDKQVYILVLYKVILFWISCLCPLVYLLADFYIIWQSNYLLTLSIPDEGSSMNTWCALNYISSSFFRHILLIRYSLVLGMCVRAPSNKLLFVLLYFLDTENKRQKRLNKMVDML